MLLGHGVFGRDRLHLLIILNFRFEFCCWFIHITHLNLRIIRSLRLLLLWLLPDILQVIVINLLLRPHQQRYSLRWLVHGFEDIEVLEGFLVDKHLFWQNSYQIFCILIFFVNFVDFWVVIPTLPILLNLFLYLINLTLNPIKIHLIDVLFWRHGAVVLVAGDFEHILLSIHVNLIHNLILLILFFLRNTGHFSVIFVYFCVRYLTTIFC